MSENNQSDNSFSEFCRLLGLIMIIIWVLWSVIATICVADLYTRNQSIITIVQDICTVEQKNEIERRYMKKKSTGMGDHQLFP